MPEVNLSEDQDHLLRPRRVPGAQGGRAAQHLLPLQRLHGSVAGWDGCGYSRWVSSLKQHTSTNYVMHGEGGGGHFKQNLKTLIFSDCFSSSILSRQIVFWVWNLWQVDLLCIKSPSSRRTSWIKILTLFFSYDIWWCFHVMEKGIDDIHGYLLILMIFSCWEERYWWYFRCPTPSFRSRSCVWQKGLDIPAVGRGQTPLFPKIPNHLMLGRRKSNDFFGKIFFLTLAFMSSRDRNDQWLINHNGKRYPTLHFRSPKQQKQPPST